MIKRGKYIGTSLDDKAERFIKCDECGGWIDCADLGSVIDHEGPLSHPVEDKEQ